MELKILNGENSKSCGKGLNPFWHVLIKSTCFS